MTNFLWRWWWLVLMVAWVGLIVLICHVDRLTDAVRIWWWRR